MIRNKIAFWTILLSLALSLISVNNVYADCETYLECAGGGDGGQTIECDDGSKATIYPEGTPGPYFYTGEQACGSKGYNGSSKSQNGGLSCSIIPDDICNAAENNKGTGNASDTGVFKFLVWVLRILTAVVGVAAIAVITYAGILYSSAGGDSGQVAKAKTLIRDAIIGLIAYGLMFLILNFLIPGGVI